MTTAEPDCSPLHEYAEEIAQAMSLPDVKSAFNQCERYSALLHELFFRLGIRSEQVRGDFRPGTDPSTWHPRWLKLGGGGFVHYWVEAHGRIYDPTAAQFGETPLVATSLDDKRYRKINRCENPNDGKPMGEKKREGMVCHLHAERGLATEVSHWTKDENGLRQYLCEPCAISVAGPSEKIRAIKNRDASAEA